METKIRVRFAPSPTGPFSIGNARTALFNWLFARHEGGDFWLRIEDTDKARSEKKYEDDLIAGLKWLGLEWSGEIYRQSERLEIYEKYLTQLLENNLVYYCFCTSEELELERQTQLSQGLAPKYSGRCRSLAKSEVENNLKEKPAVIRLKVPGKTVSWHDVVRGKMEFNMELIGDIIIAKSLREPLYNFAAAVDDFEMKITHVIRGEDHLSNTPKQLLIQEVLDFNHPHYAHLPLILGPDKKKLSKRFLENSLNDLRGDGYLPISVLNFLVLLGWHPEKDREILSLEEMIEEFNLKRVQKAGAIFNQEKLNWLNVHYIKNTPIDELLNYLKPFIPSFWLDEKNLKKIVELEKGRMKSLKEFSKIASFFFILSDYQKEILVWKQTPVKTVLDNLRAAEEILAKISDNQFTKNEIEKQIMPFAEKWGRGETLWPLRVALSGEEASPGPIELVDVLGKMESLRRIKIAIEKLESREG